MIVNFSTSTTESFQMLSVATQELSPVPAAPPRAVPEPSVTEPALPAGVKRTFLNAVPIDAITEQECIDLILEKIEIGEGGLVVTHNLDHIRRLESDPFFASICAEADIRTADGMPVVWLSRFLRMRVPERVAGSSLLHTLSAAASKRGVSIYLLGGDEGTAAEAALALQKRNPGLIVAGTHYVPFGFEKNDAAMKEMIRELQSTSPDIVFVALGSPKQEILIARIRKHLPSAWWMGVGISFSYVSGRVRQAPAWMRNIGFEWVYRMIQEPRRLVGRYLGEGVPFAIWLLGRCVKDYFKNGRHRRSDM